MQTTQADSHNGIDLATTTQATLANRVADLLANYGGGTDTIVVAYYVDEFSKPAIRLFQWAFHSNRTEFARFMTWAIRNNRMVRMIPYHQFATV